MLSNEIFEEALFSSGYGQGSPHDNWVRQGMNNPIKTMGRGVANAGKWLYNTIDRGVDWVWDKAKDAFGGDNAAKHIDSGVRTIYGDNYGRTASTTPPPNYQYTQTSTPVLRQQTTPTPRYQ